MKLLNNQSAQQQRLKIKSCNIFATAGTLPNSWWTPAYQCEAKTAIEKLTTTLQRTCWKRCSPPCMTLAHMVRCATGVSQAPSGTAESLCAVFSCKAAQSMKFFGCPQVGLSWQQLPQEPVHLEALLYHSASAYRLGLGISICARACVARHENCRSFRPAYRFVENMQTDQVLSGSELKWLLCYQAFLSLYGAMCELLDERSARVAKVRPEFAMKWSWSSHCTLRPDALPLLQALSLGWTRWGIHPCFFLSPTNRELRAEVCRPHKREGKHLARQHPYRRSEGLDRLGLVRAELGRNSNGHSSLVLSQGAQETASNLLHNWTDKMPCNRLHSLYCILSADCKSQAWGT